MTLRLPVLSIAFLIGGWLVFDGSRARIVGDYVTPRSGPSARQLGPWSRVITALGFEPRSTVIKCLHIVIGVLWLGAAVCFQFSRLVRRGRFAHYVCLHSLVFTYRDGIECGRDCSATPSLHPLFQMTKTPGSYKSVKRVSWT